jgi:hypothetical protein
MKYHCCECKTAINPAIHPLVVVRVNKPKGSRETSLVLRFCSTQCLVRRVRGPA